VTKHELRADGGAECIAAPVSNSARPGASLLWWRCERAGEGPDPEIWATHLWARLSWWDSPLTA
jgi:hypothetical protein